MNNQRDTFIELRGQFDGSDPFMTGGHQIIKMPQGNRQTPVWARNNKNIQQILLRAFPKLKIDPKQRTAAARWAVLIQLYFRVLMSRKQTAERMGISPKAVKEMVHRINQIAATPTRKHRGRPKKK